MTHTHFKNCIFSKITGDIVLFTHLNRNNINSICKYQNYSLIPVFSVFFFYLSTTVLDNFTVNKHKVSSKSLQGKTQGRRKLTVTNTAAVPFHTSFPPSINRRHTPTPPPSKFSRVLCMVFSVYVDDDEREDSSLRRSCSLVDLSMPSAVLPNRKLDNGKTKPVYGGGNASIKNHILLVCACVNHTIYF